MGVPALVLGLLLIPLAMAASLALGLLIAAVQVRVARRLERRRATKG
ncbi:hypothetical protein [Rubellimicrobium roseum]|nr:hypothetical protein [Rubellimicrobium roseum]